MAPVVNGLIPEYEGTVAIRMYNVDTSDEGAALANEYGIQFVPSFVFVSSSGEHMDTIIGEVSESALMGALDDLE
ncbi:MAG: thioredoxin family protein [Coriobacteriia bacterium]|nr:thioredoxin family protein [Coriobacteriia bacterium]